MTITVAIPLHNVAIGDESVEFGDRMVFGPIPEWLTSDNMLTNLSSIDQAAIRSASNALLFTYDAPRIDYRHASGKTDEDVAYETAVLANLALWLARPTPACFSFVAVAPDFGTGSTIQRLTRYGPILCHPNNHADRLSMDDVKRAAQIHVALMSIARDGSLWTSVRATWAALQMNLEAARYTLFWVGLEALFGPEDGREVTYRLAQRMALFLEREAGVAEDLFKRVKRLYGLRSKIVHGRWSKDPDNVTKVGEVEDLIRRVLIRTDDYSTFQSRKREEELDGLPFRRAT